MLSNAELILRLLLAAGFGSVIGVERERQLWSAGLRTHMLVSVGSCLLMIVSSWGFQDILGQPHVVLDPSRVAAQVVSGIGFLGAGSILLRGEVIKGLTTAASIWAVAAIGLAVGGGLYAAAVAATVTILVILTLMRPVGQVVRSRRQPAGLLVRADTGSLPLSAVERALGPRFAAVSQLVLAPSPDGLHDVLRLRLRGSPPGVADAIRADLAALAGVVEIRDIEQRRKSRRTGD